METTFDVHPLQRTIDDILSEFKTHYDANRLIIDLRTHLFSTMEDLIVSTIENLLSDPCFLKTVKKLAAKLGFRFKGCKPTSIRLLSGRSLPLESPYFAKALPKSRRGRKKRNGNQKVAVIWGWPIWVSLIVAALFWHQRLFRQAYCVHHSRLPNGSCLLLASKWVSNRSGDCVCTWAVGPWKIGTGSHYRKMTM